MIIDDDIFNIELLSRFLSIEGYKNILSVHDGVKAIEKLATYTPDVIFLDIQMPVVDGWLLCEILSNVKRWKKIPIILQSALVGAENIRRGLALGAHSYIEKPLSKMKVQETLDGVFHPGIPFPPNLKKEVEFVLTQIIDSTKQAFNLMLGSQTRVLAVQPTEPLDSQATFDFGGSIHTRGMARIEVSTGWSGDLASTAAMAMNRAELSEVNDELMLDSLKEVLNMALGCAIKNIAKSFPVQVQIPEGFQNEPMRFSEDARHQYVVTFKTGVHQFPMAITFTADS